VTSVEQLARILGPDAIELLGAYVDARVEQAIELRERERRWLSVDEAATYLGTTTKAINSRVRRRTIPFVKDGRRTLVDRSALDAQLEAARW
jgi:excisionase family DNA binding protein